MCGPGLGGLTSLSPEPRSCLSSPSHSARTASACHVWTWAGLQPFSFSTGTWLGLGEHFLHCSFHLLDLWFSELVSIRIPLELLYGEVPEPHPQRF